MGGAAGTTRRDVWSRQGNAAGARRAIAREEVQRDQRHRRRYSLADSTNTVRHCRHYSK
jgi:hypothetical protein